MALRRKAFQLASGLLRPDSLLGAGSQAPSFDLLDQEGNRVKSEDMADRSHYVLIFYPGDDTPGCTKQLHDFDQLRERFEEQDCLIFGVNSADQESHKNFVTGQCYSLSLLVDLNRDLAVGYRTARRGVPRTFRAVFVVDKGGVVRSAMKDYPDPEAVLRLVERCNETGYKGTGRKGRRLVPEVSGYGIRKLVENDSSTRVLDIRDEADWETGHIPGAINIPIDWLVQRMEDLPSRDVPLVIACDQGLRAAGAARILKDSGWRKLYTLIDGMEAYKGELEAAPKT
ncbi:MAG: redoxin domain-containing protein [Myxococcota bacterium]|nr:redoxin domain-containing protein [Myxococcota bacterium]